MEMEERWRPELGEEYWKIIYYKPESDDSGDFLTVWDRASAQNICAKDDYENFNCFETEADARRALIHIFEYFADDTGAAIKSLLEQAYNAPNKISHNKISQDVFSRPDCPSWAKYAAVNGLGCLLVFSAKPEINPHTSNPLFWICPSGNTINLGDGYDTTDYANSLIERYERTAVPEWCKTGKYFYWKGDYYVIKEVSNNYLTGKMLRGRGVFAREFKSCEDFDSTGIKQARLRAYSGYELIGLVGSVVFDNKLGSAYVVSSCDTVGKDYYVTIGSTHAVYSAGDMFNMFTSQELGVPCGVFEYLDEDEEWVR
jgi:hypothetical protein